VANQLYIAQITVEILNCYKIWRSTLLACVY